MVVCVGLNSKVRNTADYHFFLVDFDGVTIAEVLDDIRRSRHAEKPWGIWKTRNGFHAMNFRVRLGWEKYLKDLTRLRYVDPDFIECSIIKGCSTLRIFPRDDLFQFIEPDKGFQLPSLEELSFCLYRRRKPL